LHRNEFETSATPEPVWKTYDDPADPLIGPFLPSSSLRPATQHPLAVSVKSSASRAAAAVRPDEENMQLAIPTLVQLHALD